MGREQKRKELKKNKNNLNDKIEENTIKLSTTIKILLSVVIILLIVYYGLAVFVTKEINISGTNNNNSSSSENTENNDSNVSNKILASSIFNQPDNIYYVYFYNFKDEDASIASALYNLTNNKVYRVDTSNGLNKMYVTEESGNKNVSNINDLKVKDPTIIKIDNDKVIEYHEGAKDIINFINKE